MQSHLDLSAEPLNSRYIFNENFPLPFGKESKLEDIQAFINEILKTPISIENKVNLFNRVSQLNHQSYRLICRNFSHYGLFGYLFDSPKLETRLERSLWIAKQDYWGITSLLPHFKNILEETSIEQRLDFYKQTASARGEWAIIKLLDNFAELGLTESSLEQRLDLCSHFVSQGGKNVVLRYFEKTEILKVISETIDFEKRLGMCAQIAATGPWAIELLSKHQKLLGILETIQNFATANERLEYCLLIVSRHPWIAAILVKHVSELNVLDTPLQKRIELHQSLIYEENQDTLDSVERLGLLSTIIQTDDLKERVELCKHIASVSSVAGLTVGANFNQFQFEKLEQSEFLFLLQHLVRINSNTHIFLLNYLKTAELDAITRRHAVLSMLPCPQKQLDIIDFYHEDLKPIISAIELLFSENKDLKSIEHQNKLKSFYKFLDDNPKLSFIKSIDTEFLIKYANNSDLQLQTIEILAYAAALLYDSSEHQPDIIKSTHLIGTILKLRQPELRISLLRQLKSAMLMQRPVTQKKEKAIDQPWSDLAWIFLCKLRSLGIEESEIHSLYSKIKANRIFKEGIKTADLLHLFLYLFEHEQMLKKSESQGKLKMLIKALQAIFSKKNAIAIISDIQSLANILVCLGFEALFDCLQSQKNPKDYFSHGLQSLLKITEYREVDFSEKFQKSIEHSEQFKDPQLLFTYLRAMKRLPPKEKDTIYALLKKFVVSVVEGNFYDVRYDTSNHPHLAKLFSHPGIKDLWVDGGQPTTLEERKEYQICELDTPHSLMALSSDVQGSCLNVNGNPSKNKCLIAYILHGEIRPIVVVNTDDNSKLVARALLRLMWDPSAKKPVLLQEKIYSNVPKLQYVNDAINEWALQKAKKMGLCLVSSDPNDKCVYPSKLEFLGGSAPYMYCDAHEEGDNHVLEGPFILQNLKLKYSPPEAFV